MFISTQLLNELSYKFPFGQVLKLFKFASKPEWPELFNSKLCVNERNSLNESVNKENLTAVQKAEEKAEEGYKKIKL